MEHFIAQIVEIVSHDHATPGAFLPTELTFQRGKVGELCISFALRWIKDLQHPFHVTSIALVQQNQTKQGEPR